VVVTVNDRGPFTKGRVFDLSLAAAKELGMTGRGLMKVTAAVQ
jgi:rare lipoprotein A